MDTHDAESLMSTTSHEIDPRKQRFPYCIVWTPIPLLTWIFPFVGHMGIATSAGVVRDFAGPYYVGTGQMAFGEPTRYLRLDPGSVKASTWDRAVNDGSVVYGKRMHNLFCDNCHSHVALCLDNMKFNNSDRWNMLKLAVWMFVFGKYVGVAGFLKTWLPFLIIVTIVVFASVFA